MTLILSIVAALIIFSFICGVVQNFAEGEAGAAWFGVAVVAIIVVVAVF